MAGSEDAHPSRSADATCLSCYSLFGGTGIYAFKDRLRRSSGGLSFESILAAEKNDCDRILAHDQGIMSQPTARRKPQQNKD